MAFTRNPIVSHDTLTGVSADDHHTESHTAVSHSDQSATGAELNAMVDNVENVDEHYHIGRLVMHLPLGVEII